MTKYVVFGWSNQADKNGPVDEWLGTCDESSFNEEHPYEVFIDENGARGVQFGMGLVDRDVPLGSFSKYQSLPMKVLMTYDGRGIEYGRPVIAFYEIPGTNTNE